MPRYYFRLADGAKILENRQGIDLPGNATARDDAFALARHLKHALSCKHGLGRLVHHIIDTHGHKIRRSPDCGCLKSRVASASSFARRLSGRAAAPLAKSVDSSQGDIAHIIVGFHNGAFY